MVLGKRFEVFVQQSPASAIVRRTVERIFSPEKLDQVFQQHAGVQYTREITFRQCLHAMAEVVTKGESSLGAWHRAHVKELGVTRQALYDKLKRLDQLGVRVATSLVRYAASEVSEALRKMPSPPQPLLPGYRVRVLDSNHLAGTEQRISDVRRRGWRAPVLAGQALVLYDPQFDVVTDVISCKAAFSQGRSLADEVAGLVAARDVVVADHNFCTPRLLFGLRGQGAFFAIRQHGALLCRPERPRPPADQDPEEPTMEERAVSLAHPESGQTLAVRQITLVAGKPTRGPQRPVHILTDLPPEVADARRVAELYRDHWTVRGALERLAADLKSPIDTLPYPKAALFGFCVALVVYNAVALVKGALRAA